MKTPADPRHLKRIRVVQELFAWQFHNDQLIKEDLTHQVTKKLEKIDEIIAKAAPEWPISQINKTDLSILRLATFELIMNQETPFRVIVDEAIELAKKFGSDSSPGFINGVLGKIISEKKLDKN